MKSQDPNLAKVEQIAAALGTLREDLVFVGGCCVGLLVSPAKAAQVRSTKDVDLTAPINELARYYDLEARIQKLGFVRDMRPDAPICRWLLDELAVDLMPSNRNVLGFANRWYPLAIETAQETQLPNGTRIRLVNAPVFLATKLDAFTDRGHGDILSSHDLEDILTVVDGRPTLLEEVRQAPAELRKYLGQQVERLLADPTFVEYLPGLLGSQRSGDARAQIVRTTLEKITACTAEMSIESSARSQELNPDSRREATMTTTQSWTTENSTQVRSDRLKMLDGLVQRCETHRAAGRRSEALLLEERIRAHGDEVSNTEAFKKATGERIARLQELRSHEPAGTTQERDKLFDELRSYGLSAKDSPALVEVRGAEAKGVSDRAGVCTVKVTDERQPELAVSAVCQNYTAHLAREHNGLYSVRLWANGHDRDLHAAQPLGAAFGTAATAGWALDYAKARKDPPEKLARLAVGMTSEAAIRATAALERFASSEERVVALAKLEMRDLLDGRPLGCPEVGPTRTAAERTLAGAVTALHDAMGEAPVQRPIKPTWPESMTPEDRLRASQQGLERAYSAWARFRDTAGPEDALAAHRGRGTGGELRDSFQNAWVRAGDATRKFTVNRELELRQGATR